MYWMLPLYSRIAPKDVFTTDMWYHQSCYNHVIYIYEEKSIMKAEITDEGTSALSPEKELIIVSATRR